jgi:uncharacterized OsmC-like protein/alpha/beta superfamily hydrolase
MKTLPFDFTGGQGQKLSGRLDLPNGPARAYALFAHCFTCTKSSVASVRIARTLTDHGIGVLRFDFTGLGDSEGSFSEGGFSADIGDLIAAVGHMSSQGYAPSLLIGHSFGGAAALAAAHELPDIAGVVTIAAPFDVKQVASLFGDSLQKILDDGEARVDLAGRPFTIRRAFIDDLAKHDQAARIAALHRPLLVLHSPLDLTVSIENATSIFVAAKHPKSFISLDHADHLLTRPADASYVAEMIAAWASRYLPAPAVADEKSQRPEGAVVEETGVGEYQVEVRAGNIRFFADEPTDVGGLASGPNPYDLVSAALGACTAMTLRMYAKRKAWPLLPVRVDVVHSKNADATPADTFSRVIHIEGDLDETQKARLLDIAGHCPIHRTLEQGSRIETSRADQPVPLPASDPDEHVRDMCDTCDQMG